MSQNIGFSLRIARRYLFSKKSHNAINVISALSVFGVAVGTMALVIVLSVFNGFGGLISNTIWIIRISRYRPSNNIK